MGTADRPSSFGDIPHQLRYFLAGFHSVAVTHAAFEHCPACSDAIVEAWRALGPDLAEVVSRDATRVVQLSGLAEFHARAERQAQLRKVERDAARSAHPASDRPAPADEWQDIFDE
jgi:ubiquitin-like modifier-activating enzyme ATG7